MIRPRHGIDRAVQAEPSREALRDGEFRASLPHDADGVIHDTADTTADSQKQPPLYASGISWIDQAYEVIRQLRRNHGLPEIRPLADPPHQSEV
jgi:hypothetical protein